MRASKIYPLFIFLIYYRYNVEWQDKNDNRIDLNWFKHSFHQIGKPTRYAVEEKDVSQADSLYQILFTLPPICVIYNQRSKVVENVIQ